MQYEALFIVLSFIGVFAAGFFACLLLILFQIHLTEKKAKRFKERKPTHGEIKRTEHRSGDLQ